MRSVVLRPSAPGDGGHWSDESRCVAVPRWSQAPHHHSRHNQPAADSARLAHRKPFRTLACASKVPVRHARTALQSP